MVEEAEAEGNSGSVEPESEGPLIIFSARSVVFPEEGGAGFDLGVDLCHIAGSEDFTVFDDEFYFFDIFYR